MDGYDDTTYGDAFADVYDDWYEGVSDVDLTVATLLQLAGSGAVLELGVGTGRLAIALATAGASTGVSVSGVDSSRAMLDRLAERDAHGLVTGLLGDMTGPLPDGPFDLVFVAYNTLFNLTDARRQAACFDSVAEALTTEGRFVVEAFVPDDNRSRRDDVSVRTLAADRVVLSVSIQRPEDQVAEGQFIELTEAGGVRLRPWSIRYAGPDELDSMAAAAGFHVEHRWESFGQEPFSVDSERHVTVYRRD